MKRDEILTTASRLIKGERDAIYGSPLTNHQRIAALWTPILGTEVTPAQVALCMAQVKISRLVATPDHEDSFVDAAAYIAIAGEIETETS